MGVWARVKGRRRRGRSRVGGEVHFCGFGVVVALLGKVRTQMFGLELVNEGRELQ